MNKRSIIAVVNGVSETSMPVNEFVKFRQNVYDEVGIIFTLNKIDPDLRKSFSSIEMYSFLDNPKKFISLLWNSSNKIIHTHQPRSALMITFLTLIMPRKFNIVATIHNNFTKFNSINKFVILFNLFFTREVCFVSKSSYESFPILFKKLWNKKAHVITNGVDIDSVDSFIDKEDKNKNKNDRIELINVGKLRKQKNHEQLLRIMAKVPDNYHLTIVGAGSEEKNLLDIIKDLNIANKVTMTGLIPRVEVYRLLINSDIFINPALWEGMPIGVLEAMACRLPVLLSDIPPHKELEKYSSEKFICTNDETYIDKIYEYTSLDDKVLKNMGHSNRKIVEDFYSLKNMHKKYDKVYDRILN